MPNKVRVCDREAEEGTFQQKLWVVMEGQWGDSKEEKRIARHCLQDCRSMPGTGLWARHLHLDLTLEIYL